MKTNSCFCIAAAMGVLLFSACEGIIDPVSPKDDAKAELAITEPTGGSLISGTVTIVAEAANAAGISRIVFYIDGSAIGEKNAQPYSFVWEAGNYPAGPYTISAKAFNAAGAELCSCSISISVTDSDSPDADIVVTPPSFITEPGTYKVYTPIYMQAPSEGSTIYYTTDGSVPTSASMLYDPLSPPVLSADSTWQAIVVKNGKASAPASAAYEISPFYPGFVLKMESGMRWNYKYTWYHWVGYSYNDSTFTVNSEASFLLTEPATIAGKSMFAVATSGGQAARIRWKYLGCDEYRIYGSTDGETVQILFDAQYGLWSGQSFFGSFGEGAALSLTQSGEDYLLYKGWSFNDNNSVYYPETGTIYDPDYYSGYSQTSEKYRSGIGPYYWRNSGGSTSSSSASSDTYTLELVSLEENIDISLYLADEEILEENAPIIVAVHADTGYFTFTPDNSFADYVFYAELIDGGNPSISAYSWKENMKKVLDAHDFQSGNQEFEYLANLGGKTTFAVTGLPAGGGRIRICVMKSVNGETSGYYMASVPYSSLKTMPLNRSLTETIREGRINLFAEYQYNTFDNPLLSFEPPEGYGQPSYCFVIPLVQEMDPSICLVKAKTLPVLIKTGSTEEFTFAFADSDFLRHIDAAQAGKAEVLKYTGTKAYMAQVWEDADSDGAIEITGDFIFGWGQVP